jgi:hypothetical protein
MLYSLSGSLRLGIVGLVSAAGSPGPSRGAPTLASRFTDELGPAAPRAIRGTDWAASGYSE